VIAVAAVRLITLAIVLTFHAGCASPPPKAPDSVAALQIERDKVVETALALKTAYGEGTAQHTEGQQLYTVAQRAQNAYLERLFDAMLLDRTLNLTEDAQRAASATKAFDTYVDSKLKAKTATLGGAVAAEFLVTAGTKIYDIYKQKQLADRKLEVDLIRPRLLYPEWRAIK
jgi:hypothetical protein